MAGKGQTWEGGRGRQRGGWALSLEYAPLPFPNLLPIDPASPSVVGDIFTEGPSHGGACAQWNMPSFSASETAVGGRDLDRNLLRTPFPNLIPKAG